MLRRAIAVLLSLFLAVPAYAIPMFSIGPRASVGKIPKATDPVVCEYTGEVDAGMVFKIRGCIEEAKKDNGHRPIHLVIMSPGGSVFAGLIALNELEQSGLYVEMEAVNICASMCATMLQYPVIQKRLVRSNTLIMIHGAAGTQEGNELAQREGQKALRAIDRSLMRIISERSGIPFEKLMKMCEKGEWMWFVGPEAVKARLADKVVKPKLAKKPVAVKK